MGNDRKNKPLSWGERGLGSEEVSLGFAIQATETEKGDGAQPKQGGRGGFGHGSDCARACRIADGGA